MGQNGRHETESQSEVIQKGDTGGQPQEWGRIARGYHSRVESPVESCFYLVRLAGPYTELILSQHATGQGKKQLAVQTGMCVAVSVIIGCDVVPVPTLLWSAAQQRATLNS